MHHDMLSGQTPSTLSREPYRRVMTASVRVRVGLPVCCCGLVNVLADLTIGRMDGLHVNETWSPAFVLFFPGAGFLEEYVR